MSRRPGFGLTLAGMLGAMALGLAALFAPLLAPHDPAEQFDPHGAGGLAPGSHAFEVRLTDGRRLAGTTFLRDGDEILLTRGGRVERIPTDRVEAADWTSPRRLFFSLGTDALGRDCLSRILHGGRISLLIGFGAALLSAFLGLGVGLTAGYAGGWIDNILMRLVDAFLAFPRLFLLLLLTALLRSGTGTVLLILAGTSWMTAARLVRGEVRSLKDRDFVAAARAAGIPAAAIVLRHIVPHALAPLIVATALTVGDLILLEAALSYLGLGVQPPTPSWGNMIADGIGTNPLTTWWVSTFAGAAIVLTVIVFALVGDGLREILDPRATRKTTRRHPPLTRGRAVPA